MAVREGNEQALLPKVFLRDDHTGNVRQERGDEHVEPAGGKTLEEFAGRTFNEAQTNVGTGSDERGEPVPQWSGCKASKNAEGQRAAAALGRRCGAAPLPVGDIENLPCGRQDRFGDRRQRERRAARALARSEERRVGNECGSTGSLRWSPDQ